MAPTKVILLSCGSYNPPTNMHLRMFEIARDHLHKMGSHVVIGGVISPVHDAYGKKDLAGSTHRCAMLRLALQNNDWIRLSNWETQREGWTTTRVTLQHHQNLLNSWVFDTNGIKHHSEIEDMDWIPEKIRNSDTVDRNPIQVKLLCGADLLESFGTPGLWAEEDIDAIVGQHGLVVVTREGSNPNQFIYDSDLLSKYMHNILIVTEWITNEISSTKIRRALKRGESVRYLVQDAVLDYIYKHEIYDARRTPEIKLEISRNTGNNYLNIDTKYENAFLTPSPSDITMETPSPVEIISIDIPDSILKKNYFNSGGFSNGPKIQLTKLVDDNETAIRDRLIGVMSENGNKLLNSMKSAYPGQAKQIIADETGESHILEEVGSIYNKKSIKNVTMIDGRGENSSDIIDEEHNHTVRETSNDVKKLDTDKDHFLDLTSCNSNDDESCKKEVRAEARGSPVAESHAGSKENYEVLQKGEKVPEIVSETPETATSKEIDGEERVGQFNVNKEALEIDGKYLKSLVSSRKSPKKCKTKGEKIVSKDEDSINRSQKMKEDEYTQCDKIDSVNSESQTELNIESSKGFDRAGNKLARSSQDFFKIQGSLDSVKFDVPSKKSSGLDSASKKSKSYESIKYDSSKSISYKSFEISCSDTLKPKSESTSQLVTASDFCTECCLASGNLGPEASFNQETFYSVESGRSSPVEEDSTECDICSACNLDSADVLETKSLSATEKCDLCEMCNDINADFEGDLVMPYSEVEPGTKDSDRKCVDNDRFEIENCGLEKEGNVVTSQESQEEIEVQENGDNLDPEIKTRVDYDEFEIENCGLDNSVRSLAARDSTSLEFLQNIKSSKRDLANVDNKKLIYASDESVVKYSMKFSLPRNVPNETQSKYGAKKISRKGSFVVKDSGCKLFQEKRRYSSVDNLQHSRQILKLSDRSFHKSKGNKLVASADNIQSNMAAKNANAKLKKLQKSANDIDSLNSENYNISKIDLIAEDNGANDNPNNKIKIRDSDMVKMILTKHGIKIISEKETAL